MIRMYEHVKIKATGQIGTVVDIRHTTGDFFTVEGDRRDDSGIYPLFDCRPEDLEPLE